MDLMDRLHQVIRPGIFEQIAQRAGLDGRKDLVVGGKAGQHQDAHAGWLRRDLPCGFDAIHLGHHQVHQDHVGVQRLSLGDGLGSVARLADHLDVALGREQRADAFADDGVVVNNHNSNGGSGSCCLLISTLSRVPTLQLPIPSFPGPARSSTRKSAPIFCARSFIPGKPRPPRS